MRAELGHMACALTGVVALGASSGCLDLDPHVSFPDAAPPRDGCTASDAGCAEAPACSDPDGSVAMLRECDESALTVCETDIALNPRHCGDCMKACDGMCGGGECLPVNRLLETPDQLFPMVPGAIAVASDYVYAITERAESVHRILRSTGKAELFLDSIGKIGAIGVGSDHLYLLIEDALWNKAKLGTSSLQMEAEGVEMFAASGPVVAWVGTFGAVHQKSNLIPGPPVELGPDESANFVAVDAGRTVAVKRSSSEAPAYTLFLRPSNERRLDPIGEGDGEPVRVRIVRGAEVLEVFVLSTAGSKGEVTRFFLSGEREPVRYTSSRRIVDFAADTTHLYLSWDNGSHGGIDALALENSAYVMSTGFRLPPRHLVVDGSDLFFVEDSPPALSHVKTAALRRPL